MLRYARFDASENRIKLIAQVSVLFVIAGTFLGSTLDFNQKYVITVMI